MSYILYIAENCHQCQQVVESLDELKINYKKINVDLENTKPPIDLFAFPALFQDEILLRYGSDIIAYFQKKR